MNDTCKLIGWLYTRSVNSRLANRLFGRAMVRPEQIPTMYIGKQYIHTYIQYIVPNVGLVTEDLQVIYTSKREQIITKHFEPVPSPLKQIFHFHYKSGGDRVGRDQRRKKKKNSHQWQVAADLDSVFIYLLCRYPTPPGITQPMPLKGSSL